MASFREAQLQEPATSLSTLFPHGRDSSLTLSTDFGSMPEPQPTGTNFGTRRESLEEQRPRQPFEDNRSKYEVSRPTTPAAPQEPQLSQEDRWLAAAPESTEYFKKHGSPVHLVWVLVEDNNIPPNAVPFGEDHNGAPLYIARVLLEGGLHLGKAGYQFSGAVIEYDGKEHIMTKYEVLVRASQGFPSHEPNGILSQVTVNPAQQYQEDHHQRPGFVNARVPHNVTEVESPNIPRHYGDIPHHIPDDFVLELSPEREARLRKLAEIKIVVLIDDSISMAGDNLWEQTRKALGGIVDISNKYGSKGIDIHFMHQDLDAPNMQFRRAVEKLFNQVEPEGEDTPTGLKLGQIFEHYLPLIEHKGSTHEPIIIIVITDGVATDQEDLERHIVDTAHRLDRNGVREDMFGIQFIQIGTDEDAAEVLHALDDHLVDHYKIRDIVDSTPFNPAEGEFDTEYMLKILLGALHKGLPESESQSPDVSFDLDLPATVAPGHAPQGQILEEIGGLDSLIGLSTALRPSKTAEPAGRHTGLRSRPYRFWNHFRRSQVPTNDNMGIELHKRSHWPKMTRVAYAQARSVWATARKTPPRQNLPMELTDDEASVTGEQSQQAPGVSDADPGASANGQGNEGGASASTPPTKSISAMASEPAPHASAGRPGNNNRREAEAQSIGSNDSNEADCCWCCCICFRKG
ncbi:hypothetical protein HYDPIDRAFT_116160 [Hydnomerulius pinastri MD-312]|uniref:VWFA domain-containing protein n=1 Tax=Hydnomerulius pinastri MD-312 TaxID=994086 RepID=A0A0C9V6I4_9AGAM|nr:hypothetical protein HYDPIDRAFT_116160 [Hydnomerulius pinastri MD-312]